MVEYKLGESFCCKDNIIFIGGTGYDRLKENEQNTFICDALTHEFIHVLLENMFNPSTSNLFEFIGDKLLNKKTLRKAVNLTPNGSLWCDSIKKDGNRAIYNHYMLDNIDLIQAYIICNTRLKEKYK